MRSELEIASPDDNESHRETFVQNLNMSLQKSRSDATVISRAAQSG